MSHSLVKPLFLSVTLSVTEGASIRHGISVLAWVCGIASRFVIEIRKKIVQDGQMYIPDPGVTGSILKTIAELFNRLRKHQNSKEVFDIVRDLQSEQSKLDAHSGEADAEVTRLKAEMTKLKNQHAEEIAKLKKEHADEIARMTAEPSRVIPYAEPPALGGFGDLGDPL